MTRLPFSPVDPTPLPLPDPAPRCIPYAQASAQQIAQALAYSRQVLSQHFPTLGVTPWTVTMQALQPNIWVASDAVYFDYDDLCHLTLRLAASPDLPTLDPPIYPDRACYLAKRLVNYQDEALEALTDLEANPLAYGPRVFALVVGLALGNAVADAVFRATHRGPQGRPGSPDPALARATAHERVQRLRHARGEVGYQDSPATPENPAGPAE